MKFTKTVAHIDICRCCIYICTIVIIIFLLRLLLVIGDQLTVPFDLAYESPNLSTIMLIKKGINPYDSEVFLNFPFNITIYTPLYHYLTSIIPFYKGNPFLSGRLVSLISMLLASLALFFINKDKKTTFISFIAIGVFFSFWPVISNTAFLKNDSLALFLSAYAIIFIHNPNKSNKIILSSIFCVLAIASKQSYIAASATCITYLFFSNKKHLIIFLKSYLLISLFFLSIICFIWGSGFWFSTIFSLKQEVSISHGLDIITHLFRQPLLFILFFATISTIPYSIKKMPNNLFSESPYFLYFLYSTFFLLLTIGKIGSSTNYFFEFYLSLLMYIIFFLSKYKIASLNKWTHVGFSIIFLSCCLFELKYSQHSYYSFIDRKGVLIRSEYYRVMKNEIKSLRIENPSILNIDNHIHAYSVTENLLLNDPYLYYLLWKDDILAYIPLTNSIYERKFDIIMLSLKMINYYKQGRFVGPYKDILDEIMKYYQLERIGSGYGYYVSMTQQN